MMDLHFLARLGHSDALETDRKDQYQPDRHRPCTMIIVYDPWLHTGIVSRQPPPVIVYVQGYGVTE